MGERVKLLSEDALVELERYAHVEWMDRPGNEMPQLVAHARLLRELLPYLRGAHQREYGHVDPRQRYGSQPCDVCALLAQIEDADE